MRVWAIKEFLMISLGLLCALAACTAQPNEPARTGLPSPIPTDQFVLPTPTTRVESPTVVQENALTPTQVNHLDVATTFEVIAAVQANLLKIEEWLSQDFSFFERQAITRPIAEISMFPLGAIFGENLPHPALAESWQQAAEIHRDFYPQLMAWVDGDLSDAGFSEKLEGLSTRSAELVAEADQIVSQLGVETSQYGSDYALAVEVVFRLAPGGVSQGTEWNTTVSEETERTENPDLVIRELNPFVYPFAGTDVFLAIGLLENTGARAQERVEVSIKFYNFLGEHLGTLTGRLLARVAFPGVVYPFSATIIAEGEEAALKDWVEVEVTVFSQPYTDSETVYQDFNLSVASASPGSSGSYTIKGTLTNLGGEKVPTDNIRIGVMAFDSDGKIAGVGNGSVPLGEVLSAGMTVAFEAVLEAVSGEPVRYQFFAEADLGF
jgi:hypothetical protein